MTLHFLNKETELLFCVDLQMCVVHQHILQVSSIPGLTVGQSPSIVLFRNALERVQHASLSCSAESRKKCLKIVNIHVKCV